MSSYNCEYINKKYKCKNCSTHIIKSINLCYNHSIILYNKYVIMIQKIYIGYRTRKKLKNLFTNLPTDLQKIIIFHINKPIYYKRYYNKINNIVRTKCAHIFNFRTINKKISISYITNCYELYYKYRRITYLNELKYLYVISNEFEHLVHYIFSIQQYNIPFDIFDIEILKYIEFSNNITNINLNDTIISELLLLINTINKFKIMYKTYYNISTKYILQIN